MKHYGKLIHPRTQLTTEVIKTEATGITKEGRYYRCLQCESNEPQHFYQYYSSTLSKMIVYCRNCISLGRIDDMTIYKITESFQNPSQAYYNLPFELSAQQAYASEHIVQAIQNRQTILLYAVTGAGKTEMMFQGIQYARRQGDNIAVVSPRVDVVVEISKRIQDAFKGENIDVLHQQSQQQFNGHFVISTVHQLYRFKKHFDTIFVDEVDAFPLAMNNTLQQALISSAKEIHTMTYMTATPPKHLLATIPRENIIKLPARFHKKSLPVPKFQYFKLKESKIQHSLYKLLIEQTSNKRYTLVFFNNIDIMIKTFSTYKNKISRLTYVHSEDVFRFEKVENLRNGNYDVIFTTTILERGFTMANLDVVVIDAHQFSKEALIQIAGRVGRKLECPKGKVLYFHQGVSLSMMLARKEILQMNRLALKRGWIDE